MFRGAREPWHRSDVDCCSFRGAVYGIPISNTAAVCPANTQTTLCTSTLPYGSPLALTDYSWQKKCLFAPKTQRRGRHYVPALTHGQKFARDGVGDAMSPDGFDIAWTQYQGYTVSRLNELTVGTAPSYPCQCLLRYSRLLGGPEEGRKTKDLLIQYARVADKATLFNHASMAYNNHFMFSTLVRPEAS